ncbi:hypothetical protein Tco_0126089, partial [Tanacetum coccineum]
DEKEEEDEEIEESLDSKSMSEDVEDEGPITEDEDPATEDKGLVGGDKGPGMGVESRSSDDERRGLDDEGHSVESDRLGLVEEDEAVLEVQQRAVLVVGATVSAPLGLEYKALRHRELALEVDQVYSTFKVGKGSGSATKSKRPERVSTSRQPTLTTWTNLEDGMVYIDVPAYPPLAPPVYTTSHFSSTLYFSITYFITHDTADRGLIHDHTVRLEDLSPALFKRYDRDIGELFTRLGAVRDEIFS